MELNQKTKFTTVKNEYYSAMLVTLDDALRNWDSFSRLDRLEYAYKCLELARSYTCSTRGVNPSQIAIALEIMPAMGYTHAIKTKDDSALVTTTLSVSEIISNPKLSPISILRAALHEETHACDEILLDVKHFENAPAEQFKPGQELLPLGYHQELIQNYHDRGIAWLGKPEEIRADEVGFGVVIDLLKDLNTLYQGHPFYDFHTKSFTKFAETQLSIEYQAEKDLIEWQAQLYQKYLPEGQTSYPIIDETFAFQDYEEPVHTFATIKTIREIANQNEQLFKTPGYVKTELTDSLASADPSTHTAITEQFRQTNLTCINQIEQLSPPTTTSSFMENASAMVLTLS